jgi:hypothetical protein
VTTSTPVRAIKAKARSGTDQTAARRAIEEPSAPAKAPRRSRANASPTTVTPVTENAFVAPKVGKPETQLMFSFLLTAAIVFAFTVLLPLLLRVVRNF